MFKVFISYSQNDSSYAKMIERELKPLGLDVFLDQKSINWGDVIVDKINDNLFDCDAILVLVSHESLKSRWVPYEIGYATALGKPILSYIANPGLNLPTFIDRYKHVKDIDELKVTFGSKERLKELKPNSKKVQIKLENSYLSWWEENYENRVDEDVLMDGFRFFVDKRVFSPSLRFTFSTYFTGQFLSEVKGKKVLDLGCGCGVLGILSALRGAESVTATDNNMIAIENTKENISRMRRKYYRKKKPCFIELLHGDLFKPIDTYKGTKKFDIIFANLPIAFKSNFWADSTEDCKNKFDQLLKELPNYLETNGKMFLAWASFGDRNLITDLCVKYRLSHRLATLKTFGIVWSVYIITNRSRFTR